MSSRILKISLLFAQLFLVACASSSQKESPVIYFSNVSPDPIKDIRCEWVENVLTLPVLNPGDSRSQSFYINKNSQFFGLIRISWVNSVGEKIDREFYFREKNLPSISDHTTYNFAQIYLDQHDLEIVSSDAPDLSGKTRRMDQLLTGYRNQYLTGHPAPVQTSLIRVQPKKDTSSPRWLNSSF